MSSFHRDNSETDDGDGTTRRSPQQQQRQQDEDEEPRWPNHPLLVRYCPSVLNVKVVSSPSAAASTCGGAPAVATSSTSATSTTSSTVTAITAPPAVIQSTKPLKIHQSPAELSSIPINNEYFEGKCHLMIRGLPGSPLDLHPNLHRKMEYIVQGRFKQRLSFARVMTGPGAWSEPLAYEPPAWIFSAVSRLLMSVTPDMSISGNGRYPHLISPLVGSMQNMCVNAPGEEPNIFADFPIVENLSLLGGELEGLSVNDRKVFFGDRANLSRYSFEPGYVWTFDFYQHLLDFNTFKLDLGLLGMYDVLPVLGKKPLQVMALILEEGEDPNTIRSKEPPVDGSPFWNFIFNIEIWHARAPPPHK